MMRPKPRPFPSIPRPNERLPKGDVVTVAASVFCDDGVVLCADTEETITDEKKGNRSKIRIVQKYRSNGTHIRTTFPVTGGSGNPLLLPPEWTVGVVGAGYSDWILAFLQGMEESFFQKIDKDITGVDLKKLLEGFAQEFFTKYIRSYAEDPSLRPQANMLVSVESHGKPPSIREIYRINDNLVLEMGWESYVAVGRGAPAFLHLAENLLVKPYNIRQAASIAVYIMDRVKSEVSGCGGNSHIVMIGTNGKIETITTRRVREIELHHLDAALRIDEIFAEELVKELP